MPPENSFHNMRFKHPFIFYQNNVYSNVLKTNNYISEYKCGGFNQHL